MSQQESSPALRPLSRLAIVTLAMAAALSVGSVYAVQPILDMVGQAFGMAPAALGWAVTLTQLGYGAGLFLLVPLSDLIDRRKLIAGQISLSALALIAVMLAGSPTTLLAALALVGFLAVVVQTIVAFASALAPPAQRGRIVGSVTSGIVIGILGARFLSGVIGDLFGWRAVYGSLAAALCAMAFALHRILPPDRRRVAGSGYGATLRKLPLLFLHDRLLLMRGLFALTAFASFSSFWTALVLPLSAPPHSLSHAAIGLFGIVGIAGTLGARGAGRWVDRGHERLVSGASLGLLSLSWAVIALMPWSLGWLIAGMLMLDFAVQAIHVTNQTLIVGRYPDAAGSVIAGYMIFYSIGSALGAAGSTYAYAIYGWNGVCAAGAAISLVGLLLWIATGGLGKSMPED